jgi:tetratricopeptide (TPR) repeat protein
MPDEGTSASPRAGWTVTVRYTARGEDGAVVDDSSRHAKGGVLSLVLPTTTTTEESGKAAAAAAAGSLLLLPGLRDALQSLPVGGSADVRVPASEVGAGSGAKGGGPVTFHLELLSAHEPAPPLSPSPPPPPPAIPFLLDAVRHKEDGNRLLTRGDLAGALAAYRQAAACVDVHEEEARATAAAGGAAASGATAASPTPSSVRAAVYSNLSLAHIKRGEWAEAEAAADRALLAEPGAEKARYRRALARMEGKGPEAAREEVERLCADAPGNPASMALLERVRRGTGEGGREGEGKGEGRGEQQQQQQAGEDLPSPPTRRTPGAESGFSDEAGTGVVGDDDGMASSSSSSSSGARARAAPARMDPLLRDAARRAFNGEGGGLYADAPNYAKRVPTLDELGRREKRRAARERGEDGEEEGEGSGLAGWASWACGGLLGACGTVCGMCCGPRRRRGGWGFGAWGGGGEGGTKEG